MGWPIASKDIEQDTDRQVIQFFLKLIELRKYPHPSSLNINTGTYGG
jgi:hypothetical protein